MNEPNATSEPAGMGGKGVIYVVDDEAMLLELAIVILEPLGYEIRTFRDPGSALQAYASADSPPVLVITDYSMHAMNGIELIEGCRRVHPRQKTLMLSGTVGVEILQTAVSKPDRFLAKPYHAKQLVDAVTAILAG